MGQQQLLLVLLGIILVGIAIAVGISVFEAQSVRSNLDGMINDFNHIAASAYQFRGRPVAMNGGQGDYTNFVIPTNLSSSSNATYVILSQSTNEIVFHGTSAQDPSNTIEVRIDSEGKLGSWTYTGGFQ